MLEGVWWWGDCQDSGGLLRAVELLLFVGGPAPGLGITALDGHGIVRSHHGDPAKACQGRALGREEGARLMCLRVLNAKYCLKDKKRTTEPLLRSKLWQVLSPWGQCFT